MSDTLVKIARSKPVVAVTERVAETELLEPEDLRGHLRSPRLDGRLGLVPVRRRRRRVAVPSSTRPTRRTTIANAADYRQELGAAPSVRVEVIGIDSAGSVGSSSRRTTHSTTLAGPTAWTSAASRVFRPNPKQDCNGSTSWSSCLVAGASKRCLWRAVSRARTSTRWLRVSRSSGITRSRSAASCTRMRWGERELTKGPMSACSITTSRS